MEERRKARRFSVNWEVVVKGNDKLSSGFEETGSLVNVSSRGAFMHLARHLSIGKKLLVSIRLPLEEVRWMSYRAKVVWCENHGTKLGVGVGIRFTTVHPKLVDAP